MAGAWQSGEGGGDSLLGRHRLPCRPRPVLLFQAQRLTDGRQAAVVEKVLNDDFSGTRMALTMDLHMLVVTPGGARERSEAEYRTLLEGTGFRAVEVMRLEAPRDLIVARKA